MLRLRSRSKKAPGRMLTAMATSKAVYVQVGKEARFVSRP
jgi:hypothetical protein